MSTQVAARRPTRNPSTRDLILFPLEDIHRDGKTFSVPIKDSVSGDSVPAVKRRFFDQTLHAIKTGNGPHSTKLAALCTRFSIGPAKLNEARNRLITLFDYDADVIVLTHPNIFTFTDLRLQNENAVRLPYDIAGADLFDLGNTRATARFFGASVHINAYHAHPSCTAPSLSLQVAIRLPIAINAMSLSFLNRNLKFWQCNVIVVKHLL